MKRGFRLLSVFSLVLFALVACKVTTSTSYGLNVQKAVLAHVAPNGRLSPARSDVFQRGQAVALVLVNVGKFKKDAQGLNWFDMNLKITGPDGSTVLAKDNLLGNHGHIALANDVAPSPHGIFTTAKTLKPGKYQFKITIFDKIGKGSASRSESFILK